MEDVLAELTTDETGENDDDIASFNAANDNEAKFEDFHTKNPHVYELVKHFTKQVINAGHKHYGIQTILERIRWHTMVENSGDPFKVNNNHGRYYARKFMEDHPEHEGFFRTRNHGGSHA